jgi:hypothetical protein
LGNNFYQVESRSSPGEHYNVDLAGLYANPRTQPKCPCKGWSVRKWCSHIDDAVVVAVRREFMPHDRSAEVSPGAS